MPCIRNLSLTHALQYFDDDIRKKQTKGFDYYSQEDGGLWFGKTAERLGLINKQFSRDDYHNLMKGKFNYYDKVSGKNIKIDLTKNSKNKEHHSGIELTLSAPKSISVMAEVFKDKRVLDSHIKAVNSVLEYIQDNFIYTRTKINGKITLEKVDNLIATKFTHHTNRNHDPQLHTHILIANITLDQNNKVKTAEHSTVFENERFIRELYHNELANNLMQLGYAINWQKKVTQLAPEIVNIPQELLDLFSSRRNEIENFAEAHKLNITSAEAMQFACLATRKAKDNSKGIDELSPVWLNKVKELGINIDTFKTFKDIAYKKHNTNNKTLNELINNSLDHLTERKATFTGEELISTIMTRNNGLYGLKEIAKAIAQNKELINNKKEIEKYQKQLNIYSSRNKTVYTTKTQLALENKIIDLVKAGNSKFKSISDLKTTNLGITNQNKIYNTLNNSQKNTIDFILNNRDQFLAIQGYAGVGKTYTIKALNEELKNNNLNLIGLAPTHSAALTLKEETNIDTNTLQSFLAKYDGYANDREINNKSLKQLKEGFKDKIILVDEASLIGNRQMKNLLTIANKFNARVILQGDKKQLDSVEAGTPFQRLIDNNLIKYSELDNILRQRNEIIKQAVYDTIKKSIKTSLDRLNKNNSIIELRTNEETKKNKSKEEDYNKHLMQLENNSINNIKKDLVNKTVEVYNNLSPLEKENTLIITSSNEIRREINNKIRENLKIENNDNTNNKTININTLELKSLTLQERKEIENYEIGNTIIFTKDNTTINVEKNREYNILEVDKNKKQIILKEINNKTNKAPIIIDVKKYASIINEYTKETKELMINDRIKFNTTAKEMGIVKGNDFTIKAIDEKTKTIILMQTNSNGNSNKQKEITLNQNNPKENELIKHIDYAYATTTYSSQGKTSQNVIYTLESYRPFLTNQKDFYVGLSRTKDNITIITDNLTKSIETLLANEGEQLGAKDVELKANNNTIDKVSNKQEMNLKKNKDLDVEL